MAAKLQEVGKGSWSSLPDNAEHPVQVHPPELNDLVFVCANLYTRPEFAAVEKEIMAIVPDVSLRSRRLLED